jgi:carbamoyltransferase
MLIIGVSGLPRAVDFKRRRWPGLPEREYRISQGHDSAAALLRDGEILAAVAEERICRRKHTGEFPLGAIGACLAQAGLCIEDVDEIAHSFDYTRYKTLYSLAEASRELYSEVLSPEAFDEDTRRALPRFHGRIAHVDHHLAHAASAHLTSGWQECLVIVLDGMGEAHGASVFHARDGGLEVLHRISAADSIGILYSIVTLHLGFEFNADEYKIMGLAPYGDARRFASFFEEAVQLREDGGWSIPLLKLGGSPQERERHLPIRAELTRRLTPPREPEGPLSDEQADVAAALQACLDRALVHLCCHFGRVTGLGRLALAGGVALNTTANARLAAQESFEEIYVQPAAGDDGSALGAALHRAGVHARVPNRRSPTPFYGPGHPAEEIDSALRQHADRTRVSRLGSLAETCESAAELIAAGHVVAWYRGRMEFGPRALGHRSILADPGLPDMRDRVNELVKMREAFRPFAPAVAIEEVDRWFMVPAGTELPYMTVNVSVRPEHREELPAVTHVDGSSRVQTVAADDNADFHELLVEVGRHTGRRMVLNTSFNVRGQPIVNTPAEAIATFLDCGIEALFLENTLVLKA